MNVALDPCEMKIAYTVARHRFAVAKRNGQLMRHGESREPTWEYRGATDVAGACGELVVAKAQGWYWGGGDNNYRDGDFPVLGVEVRTPLKSSNRLWIFDHDEDERTFVLVVADVPEIQRRPIRVADFQKWRIVGACTGARGRAIGRTPPPEAMRAGSERQVWVEQHQLYDWPEAAPEG